eukprot:159347-Karenia_brevis.AAC.1
MGSPGGRSAFLSRRWEYSTTQITLKYDPKYQQRFTDKNWVELLNKMRYSKPKPRRAAYSVTRIMRNHRAWRGAKPTQEDIRWLLDNHPETTPLATSRDGCAQFNELALEAEFGDRRPL